MKLATFDDDRVGLVVGDEVLDLTDVVRGLAPATGSTHATSTMRRLIERWSDVRPLLDDPSGLPRHRLADVALGAPVPDPSKVVAAPVNYVDHMDEMNQAGHVSSLGIFLKAPSSVVGPDSVVRLPYDDRRFDHEGELALVVGRTARHVAEDEAESYVFGYTGLLDMTMRGGEDRSTRKSFDTFTPMGPWLVTPDEVGSSSAVDLRLTVDGVQRQHAGTGDLIWGVAKLIAYASSVMTLHPGDVLTTGTPAGVGPVSDGSRVRLELSGIGVLEVSVSDAGATPCPTLGAGKGPVPPPPPAA